MSGRAHRGVETARAYPQGEDRRLDIFLKRQRDRIRQRTQQVVVRHAKRIIEHRQNLETWAMEQRGMRQPWCRQDSREEALE